MKSLTILSVILVIACGICAIGREFYKNKLAETKQTLAYVRAENTHNIKPYFIGKVLKKDTVPGYYSYSILGDEDVPENAVTLTTKNLYRVGDYVCTNSKDSIK